MYENALIHHTTLNSRDESTHSFVKRTGKLDRSFDPSGNRWVSHAEELKLKDLPGKYRKRFKSGSGSPPGIHPLSRNCPEIIDFLQSSSLQEWDLFFRSHHLHRLVLRSGRERRTSFQHQSIRVRFLHPSMDNPVELGEGMPGPENSFNQEGLIQRIRRVITNNREKKPLKPGKMPVILAAGNGGILFHEILGHSLEADYIYQGASPFSPDHLNQKILSDSITLTTGHSRDPFFEEIACDDEGSKLSEGITLVRRGRLKNLICDYFFGKLLQTNSTGHCRVDSFENIPMPRMFALYLHPGSHSPEEIIAGTRLGIYAREFGPGHLDFNRGIFYFTITEARLVRRGKLSEPLGTITVSGDIVETLNSIETIGNDFRFDSGLSYCSKKGQTIHVRLGQPTVKINNIQVGYFRNA